MSSKNKVIKSVGFNKTNQDDAMILKAINRRNFSGYVKKLILADIAESKPQLIQEKDQEQQQPKKEKPKEQTAADKLERLKQQQKRPGSSGPRLY